MTLDKDTKRYIVLSLVAVHIWGTIIIVAMARGRDSTAFAGMFDTIGWMIFSILGVLTTGKGFETFAQLRLGANTVVKTVTEEKTAVTTAKDTENVNPERPT